MTKEVLYIFRTIVVLVVLGVAWWWWSDVVDAIRAPVIAETNKAIAANQSLDESNKLLIKANTALSDTIVERGKFEGTVDTRLQALEKTLRGLKATNPEVKKWAETPVPDPVLAQ